mgnify:CR=1 FL=1
MIEAVIFDMDGVLVDSEVFIRKAAVALYQEMGHQVQEADFLPFTGTGENRFISGVAEQYGIELDIEPAKRRLYEIYGQLIKGNMGPAPGVNAFFAQCRLKGLKTAVATSADDTKMQQNLGEINLPPATFDACVNGNDIHHKKPHPEIFLKAAGRLGVEPGHCLVVEDAVSGVQAAKAAGCRCLALTTTFAAHDLAEADWVCETLADAPSEVIEW